MNQIPTANWPVRGRIVLELHRLRDDDHAVGRSIQSLEFAPPNADVVLVVAPGQLVPGVAVDYLRRYCKQLGSVSVESRDPQTTGVWVRAIFGVE